MPKEEDNVTFIYSFCEEIFVEHLLCARLRAKPWKQTVYKVRQHSGVDRARSRKLWMLWWVGCINDPNSSLLIDMTFAMKFSTAFPSDSGRGHVPSSAQWCVSK